MGGTLASCTLLGPETPVWLFRAGPGCSAAVAVGLGGVAGCLLWWIVVD